MLNKALGATYIRFSQEELDKIYSWLHEHIEREEKELNHLDIE